MNRGALALVLLISWGCSSEPARADSCTVKHLDLVHQPHNSKELEALEEGIRHRHGVYMATLSLGTPAQNFDAIVDTGSANLVVMGPDCQGCSSVAYRPNASSSADESSSAFEVTYGS
ncbi:MAG TPA: hypothetical protein DCQ06_02475, partial [Myxococcales bacterium]|nr:hypothetical protein [Myxococcales bacterium]